MAFISTGTLIRIPVSANTSQDVTANLLSFNVTGSRPSIPTSTMATPTQSANTTNLHSATFLPGKLVTRNLEITFDYDPTQNFGGIDNALALMNRDASTSTPVKLTFSDSSSDIWSAAGFVTDYSASAGLDERVEGSMSIQLTDIPVAGW